MCMIHQYKDPVSVYGHVCKKCVRDTRPPVKKKITPVFDRHSFLIYIHYVSLIHINFDIYLSISMNDYVIFLVC